jgi:hypothetical protein
MGCSSALRIRLHDDVQRPAKSVFIFFVDGMDVQRVEELVAAGRLPHIRDRFVDQGVQVRYAISSMPSSTYPNCSAMITGRFPGHHDILGNFWFDRRTLVARDYASYSTYLMVNDDLKAPTLYDLLTDRLTVSVGYHTYRGAGVSIPNSRLLFWAWAFGDYTSADSGIEPTLNEVAEVANRRKHWPTVIMTYYPGVDEIGHRCGTNSPQYAEALENIDRIIGDVTGAFDQAGLSRFTDYVLMADHGMVPAGGREEIDILDWLHSQRGMKVRREPLGIPDYDGRLAALSHYDAFGTVDAGRVAMVHLRGTGGWSCRPGPAEVQAWLKSGPPIEQLAAVQVVLTRDGSDRVQVLSRDGTAVVERRRDGQAARYRIAEYAGDPLEYLADPGLAAFVRAGWHDSREWLAATAHARFPDFVPQVVELFDSPRTGDVVIMAADRWLLYKHGEHAGHGSCLSRDMRIPLFFSGPGLPKGATIDHGRLVDLTPTILGLLGEADRLKAAGEIDGIDLSDQLRRAAAPTASAQTR